MDIQEFKLKYIALGIPVTPKAHAVFHHVAEFCELKGTGLAKWSEQSVESLHSNFEQLWSDFKVKSFDHPDFRNRIFRAVSAYNSRHL